MTSRIAIVGMACRYPHGRSPQELWENVLAQRQAFRRIPAQRLRLDDYYHANRLIPDKTYSTQGAFIENYEFDRVHFRISGNAYRSSDLTHWLALDIANQAVLDAGYTPEQLPALTTGVVVGNTLTGEFSRANMMRLRWPYVRRMVEAGLRKEAWSADQCAEFLQKLESAYKAPFPPVGEESLAGGLSNTIAGRICNYFNLGGGGYTIDGACSSSLLAVSNACSLLTAGDIDLALAGGVDLSIDPFEIVGFAKTAALAGQDMHVYDVRSAGFLPGEGCGFVVLMRYEDALAQQRQIYAVISGWGISSDGSGGITRPEVSGQALALARAYQRADISINTVTYFEGHGTGTSVGDATEVQALLQLKNEAPAQSNPAFLGSIKANIGHTKAAAGAAGLMKAVMALHTQIIPPTTGNETPLPALAGPSASLKTLQKGMLWPQHAPLRAAVSAMGFGGINTHLVLEGANRQRRFELSTDERMMLSSYQDCELFLWRARDHADALQQVEQVLALAPHLSLAECTDLAVYLASQLATGALSLAVVARTPSELTQALQEVRSLLISGTTQYEDIQVGIFIGQGDQPRRPGFLFTSQGAPAYLHGGLWRRRFPAIDALYHQVALPDSSDGIETSIAQPAITTASLGALSILHQLGITGQVGVGHSLGELVALHWAGAFDKQTLLRLVSKRGQAMSTLGSPTGKMASLQAAYETVISLIGDDPVVVAGINSPRQTVISGDAVAVEKVVARAHERAIRATMLPVSHAFHSPLVAAAASPFADELACAAMIAPERLVLSTVTGQPVARETDIRKLLQQQITSPVRFLDAISEARQHVDFWVEVGPGSILQHLALDCTQQPALALDASGSSLKGLLQLIGFLFARGASLSLDILFKQRFSRTFDPYKMPHFLTNPCELAPILETEDSAELEAAPASIEHVSAVESTEPQLKEMTHQDTPLATVRHIIAQHAELPLTAIHDHDRMLSNLHLNSITVGQVISESARALNILPPIEPTQYADASVFEIATVLESILQQGESSLQQQISIPHGVDTWVRAFTVEYLPVPLSAFSLSQQETGSWEVISSPDADQNFVEQLITMQQMLPGTGTFIYLPPEVNKTHITLLFQATKKAMQQSDRTHLVLLQHNGAGSSLVRTAALEAPHKTVCVIDIPDTNARVVPWIRQEIQHASGYQEARYDALGTRMVPRLLLYPLQANSDQTLDLNAEDVLLVTGGGKGIAAECALALAQSYGVKLALVGRSEIAQDAELAQNLQRIHAAGIQFQYRRADVTNQETVGQVIRELEEQLGPVTAILHGAGKNVPRLLSALEIDDIYQTLAPKVDGLKNILAAVNPDRIRLLVTFGSVIARTGMRGEADYALANDWLARVTEQFQSQHLACRCLCVEWSIWSGVGMGERLGRIEALMHEGILPIPPDAGIDILRCLLHNPLTATRIVVASRLGDNPILQIQRPDIPLLRFLEEIRLYYPGIELITDVALSTGTDPYLEDHRYQGERLLPAVVGLEAMVQCAMVVRNDMSLPVLEQVQLMRPVVVPEQGSLMVRIAVLVRDHNTVEVVLRSEESGFQVDHFRAMCRFTQQVAVELPTSLSQKNISPQTLLDLKPEQLYGTHLFHTGLFQRLQGYHHLRATEAIAEVTPCLVHPLYAHYLPTTQCTGDIIARDAYIHAIQACIPQATLLPTGIDSIRFMNMADGVGSHYVYARERQRQGDVFIYDLEVRSATGALLEQWEGLHLRQVQPIERHDPWPPALLTPYIERQLFDVFAHNAIQVAWNQEHDAREQRREDALLGLFCYPVQIQHRPDGKPVAVKTASAIDLSIAHTDTLTLAVSNATCDIEELSARSDTTWLDLLGPERHYLATTIVHEQQEDFTGIATRIWAAGECLKKAGAFVHAPLVFVKMNHGQMLLRSGNYLIATWIVSLQKQSGPLVLAIGAQASF